MNDVIRLRGNSFETVIKKTGGEERVIEQDFGRSGHFAESQSVPDLVKVSAATGDTVCVGPFRFAKFDVEFSAMVELEHREEAYAICEGIVDEIVDRELAALREIKRENKSLENEMSGGGILHQMTFRVEYGCTIPTGRFESTRIAVGATEMVGENEALEIALSRVQAFVERRIVARKERVLRDSSQAATAGT
jgi:Mg2+ and Co2+ transporter CorA